MTTYAILWGQRGVRCSLHPVPVEDYADAQVISIRRNPGKPRVFSWHRGIDDSRYEYCQIHMRFEPDRLLDVLNTRRPDYIGELCRTGSQRGVQLKVLSPVLRDEHRRPGS